MDAPLQSEPPLRVLIADLATQTSTLVSKEIALAKHELTAKAEFAVKRGAVVAVGALAVAVSMLVLLAALVLALGTVMPLWASALIVGLAVARELGEAGFEVVTVEQGEGSDRYLVVARRPAT